MWILKDWLKKYEPEAKIVSGEPILRGARILSNNADTTKENLYIARAQEFISGESNKVICVQGQDMLLLNTDNIDDVLNDVFNAFDFYSDWEDKNHSLIAAKAPLCELIKISADFFRQPLVVYDSGNQVAAYDDADLTYIDEEWDAMLSGGANSFKFLENMRSELRAQRNIKEIMHYTIPGIKFSSVYRSLFIDEAFVGRLLLLEVTDTLTQGQLQLFEFLGRFIEEWMRSSSVYLSSRSEVAVFSELLEGKDVSRQEADRKLLMIGWKKTDRKELIRIELTEESSEIVRPFFNRLERVLLSEYCILFEECICIFVNLEITDHKTLESRLSSVLYSGNLCALVSYVFTDAFELRRCSEQCRLTYEYTPKERGAIYMCAGYALECIRSMMSVHIPKALAHPALEQLSEYDRENESELYKTLYVYLENNCTAAKTAAALNLHRNSLLYRLNQIKDITKISLSEADEREYLLFSYYL